MADQPACVGWVMSQKKAELGLGHTLYKGFPSASTLPQELLEFNPTQHGSNGSLNLGPEDEQSYKQMFSTVQRKTRSAMSWMSVKDNKNVTLFELILEEAKVNEIKEPVVSFIQ